MKNKKFVLGLGAQKAGTTWLHQYLSSYSSVDMGFVKEYHVWDVLTTEILQVDSMKIWQVWNRSRFLKWRMQRNIESYFEYFVNILKNEDVFLTGDITPSYSGLGVDTLNSIYDTFSQKKIEVKVVFLMRDPVERCWSAVRMNQKKKKFVESVDTSMNESLALRAYSQSQHAKFRTNYVNTISNLTESIIPSEQIYIGIYENMFQYDQIAKLSTFMELSPKVEFQKNRVNVSKKMNSVSDDVLSHVAHEFIEVYEFCANVYPEVIPLWRGYEYTKI